MLRKVERTAIDYGKTTVVGLCTGTPRPTTDFKVRHAHLENGPFGSAVYWIVPTIQVVAGIALISSASYLSHRQSSSRLPQWTDWTIKGCWTVTLLLYLAPIFLKPIHWVSKPHGERASRSVGSALLMCGVLVRIPLVGLLVVSSWQTLRSGIRENSKMQMIGIVTLAAPALGTLTSKAKSDVQNYVWEQVMSVIQDYRSRNASSHSDARAGGGHCF